MKKIIYALKFAVDVYKNPAIIQKDFWNLVNDIFKFLKKTSYENRPMITHIGMVHSEEKILTIWCGIGYTTPFTRIKELVEENEKLKYELSEMVKKQSLLLNPNN